MGIKRCLKCRQWTLDTNIMCEVFHGDGTSKGIICGDCSNKRPLLKPSHMSSWYKARLVDAGILDASVLDDKRKPEEGLEDGSQLQTRRKKRTS